MSDVLRVYLFQKFKHDSVMAARTALRFEALFVVIIVVVIVFPVVLFVLLIFAVRLVIEADSCLDWEVSQQCFTIAVEVVI